MLAPESKFAKGYLQTLVSETRISAAGATMKDSNADMAGAVSGWRPGTPIWRCPGTDQIGAPGGNRTHI